MLKDLADILQRHTFHLRVAEVDCDPPKEADCGVESESPRGSSILHLRKEGGGDDDVGAPARAGEHHRAVSTHLHWEELRREPSGVAHTRGIETHIDNHAGQDDISGPSDLVGLESEIVVDRDPVECNCS